MRVYLSRLLPALFFIISVINISSAQSTPNSAATQRGLTGAIELFNKGLYENAYIEFKQVLERAGKEGSSFEALVMGYITIIEIQTEKPYCDASFNNFEKYWYNSPLAPVVRLKYGSYLFDKEQYNQAFNVLNKIDERDLPSLNRNEFNFKIGYSWFKTGDTERALFHLNKVITGKKDSYTSPAIYYLAHIHYIRREFNKSVELFSKIGGDPRFATLSRYYTLESKFMLKDYNYVTTKGEELYNTLSGELKTKSARIISEAFFALNNNEKAQLYFSRYSGESRELSRKDLYYAGILSYSMKSYNDAIELLKQVLGESDSLSQNAAYHLGRCYIEIKNKFEALNSFRIASEGSFDLAIKEDAMFNYAKLSFDLNSDITKFRLYLDTYSPSEQKFNEVQNYIANSYLVKQDYKSAIEALRAIRNPAARDIVNLQKATFLRGMQLLNLGAYRESIPVFELSIANGQYNNNLMNVTRFWLAESYYRNNQFSRSVDINLELATKNNNFRGNREYPTSLYNLAYGYFKLGNFEQAEIWFNRYLNLPRGEILYLDEARARLGDSQFMQRKYSPSVESYARVGKSQLPLFHYAQYQISIAQGLLGDDNQKASTLKELLNADLGNSLYPEVLYELGRTLIQTGDNQGAIRYLTQLSERFSNSHYHSKAQLELGLISLNRGDYNRAIEYYKSILEQNPQSPEAQSALAGLENIYQDSGRGEEFLSYLDRLGMSQTKTTGERELILFSSAEKLFLSGNYPGAITSLNSFIKSYPNGGKSAHAYFYLGESYMKISKPELALDAFLRVMEIGEGSFTELATLNYARISYQLENYKQASRAYSSLSRIAQLENNKIEAQTGLTRSYFMDRQFINAIAEGERAVKLSLPEGERLKMVYIIGKSHFLLGERSKGVQYLSEVARNKITPEGAESTYLIISDAFDRGDFARVEREVYAFADSRSPQSYWLAKSYILLGDTFAERENWSQAEATYRSILDSYKPTTKDDIEEQLRLRLSKIEDRKTR